MSDVIVAYEGPLAITEERGDGRTFVLSGENVAAAQAAAALATSGATAAAAVAAELETDLLRVTQGLAADVFADSETGSDSATGLSLPRAKQTLAAAKALMGVSTSELAIVSDSHFREMLTLDGNYTLLSAGVGDVPIIDGADVATGWTAEGTANVWQITGWTHTVGSSSSRFNVFEDGDLLVRVANVAACSALPGSFVDVRASAGSPITLKIHPTGSGNPTSNGKLYEASRRETAITVTTGNDVVIRGPVETTRAVSNDGSLVINGAADVSRVLATFGTKHSIFSNSGSLTDTAAFIVDNPTSDEGASTFFVSYVGDPTGLSYEYERCFAVQPLGYATASFPNVQGFYAHGASFGAMFDSGSMVQCAGIGAITGGHPGSATTRVDLGNYWRCMNLYGEGSPGRKLDQTLGYIYLTHDGVTTTTGVVLDDDELENCAIYFEKRINTSPGAFRHSGGDTVIDRTTLIMEGPGQFGAHAFTSLTSPGGSITVSNSVIAGFSGSLLWVNTGVTYTGNNNVFWFDNVFDSYFRYFLAQRHGADVTTLADWQTATGQDANSVYAKSGDQVAGDAGALFLGWAEAAPGTDLITVGPAVGDFRLNPAAQVYDSADAPLTGTLADGTTPITETGQQAHWDWDLRRSVTGPATYFPVIPETIEQMRQYISAPSAWDFAPQPATLSTIRIGDVAGLSAALSAIPIADVSGLQAALDAKEPTIPALGLWDMWSEVWFGNSTPAPSAGSMFVVQLLSSGTISTAPATAQAKGYNPTGVLVRSSTTTNSGFKATTASITSQYFGQIAQKHRAMLTPATAFANNTIRTGWLNTITSTAPTTGAWFEMNGSGVWSAKCSAGGAVTTHGTTYASTIDVPLTLDVEVNAAGTSIRYRIYAGQSTTPVLDVTNTTNIPTTFANGTGSGIVATNSGTTASDICVIHALMQGTPAGYERARG